MPAAAGRDTPLPQKQVAVHAAFAVTDLTCDKLCVLQDARLFRDRIANSNAQTADQGVKAVLLGKQHKGSPSPGAFAATKLTQSNGLLLSSCI